MGIELKDKVNLARKIAVVAAAFSLIMCVLLIVNYIQSNLFNPIESETLDALVERLRDDPQNEQLMNEVRTFDLMARKAYFTNQWQLRTGGYLLALGIIISILAVRYILSSKNNLDEIDSIKNNPYLDTLLARKGILYSGIGVIVIAIVAGLFSYNSFDYYQAKNKTLTDNEIELKKETKPEETAIVNTEVKAKEELVEEVVGNTIQKEKEKEKQAEIKPVEEKVVKLETPKVEKQKPTVTPVKKAVTDINYKANYPFFRGPEGNGISYHKNMPVDWNGAEGTNISWKFKIPKHGYSSPIVWKNKVFVTGADEKSREVYCVELSTGNLLWTAVADNISGSPAKAPSVTEDTGLAAPTMATNGEAAFAIFATGDVLAVDMDGKRIWAKNIGVPDNHYGHSSSLIIYQDKLLIQYDTNRGSKLIALSIKTGEEVWLTPRTTKISWSSPLLVNTGSRMELILTTDPNVDSYDPETGELLWSVECLMGEVGPSAAFGEGLVFAANEYATFAAIKPGDNPEIVWQTDEYLPEVASPLVIDGIVLIATSYGVVAAFDTQDGTMLWEQEYSDGIYASPVFVDGKIYIMDMSGKCHIIKATKEFELVAEPVLGEKSVCAPVSAADGKLLVRGFENLYCIGK